MADIRLRRRVFVFSVTTALVIGDQQKVSVIVPAAEVVAVLAAPALIRTLQVKAFASIQLAPTLSAIAGQGRGILEDLYPRPYTPSRLPAAPLPPRCRAVLWPYRQATLQQLDLGRLLRAAGGTVIVLRAGVDDTLQQGAPVADLHGGEVADQAVLGGLVTGPERTFRQDPLLAFRLLADIAMRALSPAVNDPATAVQVLDTTESLLQALVSSPQPNLPWSCCGHGPCSPPCSTRHRQRASRQSPGGSIAPSNLVPAISH